MQDVKSAALLDITNEQTVSWLKGKLSALTRELGAKNVAFFVDSGNAFHTPTYFQARLKFLGQLE